MYFRPNLCASMFSPLQRLASWLCGTILFALLAGCGGGGGGAGSSAAPLAPTLTIESDTAGTLPGNFTLNFLFSDKVNFPTGVLVGTTSPGSATTSTFKQIANTNTYTMQFSIPAGTEGNFTFKVPAGSFKDSTATSFNTTAYEFVQPYNTKPLIGPQVAFQDNALEQYPETYGMIIKGSVTVHLSFDMVLAAPLASEKLEISTGTISNFIKKSTAGEKDVYSLTYTPPLGIYGTVQITLNKNTVQSAGMPNIYMSFWRAGVDTR